MSQAEVGKLEHEVEANVVELVNAIVAKHGYSRSKLIPILQEIQSVYGYLPRRALELISSKLNIPISEIIAVVSFYHQFRLEPVGDYIFQVCFGTACYLRGASEIYEALRLATSEAYVTVEKARCFGCCSLAPVIMVINTKTGNKDIYGRLTPSEARKVALKYSALARKKRR